MPVFILLIIVTVVVVLLLKSIHDAQQARGGQAGPTRVRAERPARTRPRPRRRAKPPVDEEKLAEHVAKLREAVDGGLITSDEAAASIVRFTDGVLSEDAAHQLLRHKDAA